MDAQAVGKYIVIDPEICHGKPTFRGTRIMVWQVEDAASYTVEGHGDSSRPESL